VTNQRLSGAQKCVFAQAPLEAAGAAPLHSAFAESAFSCVQASSAVHEEGLHDGPPSTPCPWPGWPQRSL